MPFRALPVASFCFLLLGIAYLADTLRLPLGSAMKPGAGLFPLLVGVSLLALSLALFLGSLIRKDPSSPGQEPFPQGKDRQRVLAVGVVLFAFVLLLQPLGFGISSAALMAAVFRLLGLKSWAKIILISVVAAAVSYYLFDSLLGVPLPKGFFAS